MDGILRQSRVDGAGWRMPFVEIADFRFLLFGVLSLFFSLGLFDSSLLFISFPLLLLSLLSFLRLSFSLEVPCLDTEVVLNVPCRVEAVDGFVGVFLIFRIWYYLIT